MQDMWIKSGMVALGVFLISAQAPLSLNFDSLDQASPEGKAIQIRGFLYQTPNQSFVLASRPDLKSCCIGGPSQISEQIFVKGKEIQSTDRAVTLQGVLKEEPLFDGRGELIQLYVLEEATLLPSKSFPLWTVVLVLILVLLLRRVIKFIMPTFKIIS